MIFLGVCLAFFTAAVATWLLMPRATKTPEAVPIPTHQPQTPMSGPPSEALSALQQGRDHLRRTGGVALIAESHDGARWVSASREECILVLGPPRSGKTTGTSAPSLIFYPGPAVVVSSKPDILHMTVNARRTIGTIWLYDPLGKCRTLADISVDYLRWSPLLGCQSLERARLRAHAILAAARKPHSSGTQREDPFFGTQCERLLGALLYAAAQHTDQAPTTSMRDVIDWLLSGDLTVPMVHLKLAEDAASVGSLNSNNLRRAYQGLKAAHNLPDPTRGGVLATTSNAVAAFEDELILQHCAEPNFDPDQFPTSQDTIYVIASAERLNLYAPIVAALIDDLKRATYQAHDQGHDVNVLCLIEEAARVNLHSLESIASEGGSHGFQVMAVFQDLAQARASYGAIADSFLDLFSIKVCFPGISDKNTLEGISTLLGNTWIRTQFSDGDSKDQSFSTQGLLGTHDTRTGENHTDTSEFRARFTPADIAQHHTVVRHTAAGFEFTHPASYHARTRTGALQRAASPRANTVDNGVPAGCADSIGGRHRDDLEPERHDREEA